MLFIIWSTRDGDAPRMDDDGTTIISDGVCGRITADNAAFMWAKWPDNRRPASLAVNERIQGVPFSASGETFIHDVWRVK